MPEAKATTSGSPPAARTPLVEPPAPGPELPDLPQPQRPGSAGTGRAVLPHPQPGHSRKFPLSLFPSSATRNLRAASERALRRGAGCSQALLAALPRPSCRAVCAGRCHGHPRQDGLCNKPPLTFLTGKNFPAGPATQAPTWPLPALPAIPAAAARGAPQAELELPAPRHEPGAQKENKKTKSRTRSWPSHCS